VVSWIDPCLPSGFLDLGIKVIKTASRGDSETAMSPVHREIKNIDIEMLKPPFAPWKQY
jgi:hypothetical protein